MIQWGTLVALMIYFRHDIVRLWNGFWTGVIQDKVPWSRPDGRQAWMIIVGTIPVVIIARIFKPYIETTLRSEYVIGVTAISMALLLLLAEWRTHYLEKRRQLKSFEQMTWLDAILVGLAQAVAVIPGASRSGMTITGGLFAGMTRETAARFSFLLSLPAVFGAGVLELYHERKALLAESNDALALVIATVVSGVVGYLSIVWLLGYLKHHSTYVFIGYRIIAGGALLFCLWQGIIKDEPPPSKPEPTAEVTPAQPSR